MDFDSFLQRAWTDHADAPEDVAGRLAGALTLVERPGQAARLAALVVHVAGEHLGRWSDALELLAALRRQEVLDAEDHRALDRHAAALRLAAGQADAVAGLSTADAAAALAGAAAILAGRSDWAGAIARYDQALAAAAGGLPDGAPALRALAVAGNNLAAALEELAERSEAQVQAMVRAAEAGLTYWRRAGSWLEEERAEHRLASSLLCAGQVAAAVQAADRCLAVCTREDAPALERFFAHAVRSRALHASGAPAAAAAASEAARVAFAQLAAEDRPWCEAELRALP